MLARHASVEGTPAKSRPAPSPRFRPRPPIQSRFEGVVLRRKGACACEGGCPTCQGASSSLKISGRGEAYEREADRVAGEVMRMPGGSSGAHTGRFTEEAKLSRRAASPAVVGAAETDLESAVAHGTRGGGHALDTGTRTFMESRFGHDFGRVRIHPQDASVPALGAVAVTVRSEIRFAPGRYAPETTAGRALLAHELAHVVQQRDASIGSAIGPESTAAEFEAECAADALAAGNSPGQLTRQARPSRQRQKVEAWEADLARRKSKVVSIEKTGTPTIGLFGDEKTGLVSGYQLHQDFALTLAKDARADDYALVQWIKGEMYEMKGKDKAYWPANAGNALYGRSNKEPWLFNDWIIDSPDADPRFGSDRGVKVKVPKTDFSDSPGIILQKGKGALPAGLRWAVQARIGVYPWGEPIPTSIKDWEKQKPDPFKEVAWGWDVSVTADQKSLEVEAK